MGYVSICSSSKLFKCVDFCLQGSLANCGSLQSQLVSCCPLILHEVVLLSYANVMPIPSRLRRILHIHLKLPLLSGTVGRRSITEFSCIDFVWHNTSHFHEHIKFCNGCHAYVAIADRL